MMRNGCVVALLLVGLVLAGCSDDDGSDGSPASVELPDGAAAVVDDYYEAVTVQHDGDAMLAFVTEDFAFVSDDERLDRQAWADRVNSLFDGFAVERLEEPAIVGGGSEYIVSQPERVTGSGTAEVAISVMRVKEVDGTWLLGVHEYTGTPGG